MNPQEAIALANLLSSLLPIGMQVYQQIQQAHSSELKPLEEILAKADANWDAIAETAKKEI